MSLPLLGAGSVGAVAAGPWTPTQLGSAVRAWYQMDLLAGAGGSDISSMADSSGNGFTATGFGVSLPQVAAANLNGLNTARMPSVSTYFGVSNSVVSGLGAGSFYVVYKGDATSANYTLLDAGSSGLDSHYPFSDNNFYNDFGATARKTVGAATNAVTSYRILSIYSATNDWAFYVDGGTGGSSGGTTALFSTATNTVAWTAASPLRIGATPLSTNGLVGHIAEVIFTNAKQSTSDRQKMEGYLAWKWGLTGNLDATHPYKSVAP